MSERFQDVFVGGDQAHGEWNKETGAMKTLQSPASDQDYDDHLKGVRGLGLVPIRKDGTCRIAAIDIDVDTIDHRQIYAQVAKRKMPLHVCRSKSGGAHLYLFMKEPGIEASKVIATLKKWMLLLDLPKSTEVFPKQTKVTAQNLGNWINLPYFAGDNTVRYAVGPKGPLDLNGFLESVVFWDGNDEVDDTVAPSLIQIGEMPPCLKTLTNEGLPAGARNTGLFNFAVFYRKSSPQGWEDKLVQHNQKYVHPPVSYREIQSIIKSVGTRKYQYLCDQEPICSRCDRKTCLTLPFGVGHEPWKDAENFDDFTISHLRKIMTDPPRFIVEVNGHDVELATKEFIKFPMFRDRMFELLNVIIAPMKQEQWEQMIRDMASKVESIVAPEDASMSGMVMEKLNEFLLLSERTKGNMENLLKGLPVAKDGWVWFRVSDVQKYFQTQRFVEVKNNFLYELLHKAGGGHATARVKQKILTAWRIPEALLNRQTEDFTIPDFSDLSTEL